MICAGARGPRRRPRPGLGCADRAVLRTPTASASARRAACRARAAGAASRPRPSRARCSCRWRRRRRRRTGWRCGGGWPGRTPCGASISRSWCVRVGLCLTRSRGGGSYNFVDVGRDCAERLGVELFGGIRGPFRGIRMLIGGIRGLSEASEVALPVGSIRRRGLLARLRIDEGAYV